MSSKFKAPHETCSDGRKQFLSAFEVKRFLFHFYDYREAVEGQTQMYMRNTYTEQLPRRIF